MEKKYFDFKEALSCIDCDMLVAIELDEKLRVYGRHENTGEIMCKVNNTVYRVKQFYIDAIESNKWFLYDN